MVLVYIDESGSGYGQQENFFADGPYAIWCGVIVNEKQYLHIERTFFELSNKILGKDWSAKELHLQAIWHDARGNKSKTKKVRKYLDELFQFLAKVNIQVCVGIQQKSSSADKETKKKELGYARHSLLHVLEHTLAKLDQAGILIADYEDDPKSLVKYEELKKLVFQRTRWRYDVGQSPAESIARKYEFEYRSHFILDQLHYVDSKTSQMMQLTDHIAWVVQRAFCFLYLKYFRAENRPAPNSELIPVSQDSFNMFLQSSKLSLGRYDIKSKDVYFDEFYKDSTFYISFDERAGSGIRPLMNDNLFAKMKAISPYT